MSDSHGIKELLWEWVLYHEDHNGNARRIPFTLNGYKRWKKRKEDVFNRRFNM